MYSGKPVFWIYSLLLKKSLKEKLSIEVIVQCHYTKKSLRRLRVQYNCYTIVINVLCNCILMYLFFHYLFFNKESKFDDKLHSTQFHIDLDQLLSCWSKYVCHPLDMVHHPLLFFLNCSFQEKNVVHCTFHCLSQDWYIPLLSYALVLVGNLDFQTLLWWFPACKSFLWLVFFFSKHIKM